MLSFCLATLDLGEKKLITELPNMAKFIKANETDVNSYRVFSFATFFAQYQKITATNPNTEIDSFIFAKEALMANTNIFSQIPIVGGYDTLAFRRYQNIVAYLEDTTSKKTIEEKTSIFLNKLNLLSALNVKYVVSPYILDNPNLQLVFSENVTSFNIPLYLYQNKKVLPRFYFAKNIIFLKEGEEDGNFLKVTEAKSDFQDFTYIECDKCMTSKNTGFGTLSLLSQKNEKIEIETKSNSDEWLVLNNQAVSGWRAKIDGKFVKIYYANHAYIAINVPKGEHKVEFYYSLIPDFFFNTSKIETPNG